jgi:hypothetical protein
MALGVALMGFQAVGADYYLNNTTGSDHNSGLKDAPMATYKALEGKLKPGDTVHLDPTGKIYRQEFVMHRASGAAGQPIVIDGHDQTVSGAEIVPSANWQDAGNGTFTLSGVPAKVGLIIDGKVVLEQLSRDSLKPGEWCWEFDRLYFMPIRGKKLTNSKFQAIDKDGVETVLDPKKFEYSHSKIGAKRYRNLKETVKLVVDGTPANNVVAKDSLKENSWCSSDGKIHYRPKNGMDPAQQKIEAMVRGNCFALGGNSSFITIRNVTVQHPYNDGVNIHGRIKGIKIENIKAFQCGDEGVSAHDTTEVSLDTAVIKECDNGIMHVNDCRTITRNAYISDCRAIGIGFQPNAKGEHLAENIVLKNNGFTSWGNPVAKAVFRNILFVTESGRVDLGFWTANATISEVTCVAPAMRFKHNGNGKLNLTQALFEVGQLTFDFRKTPEFATLESISVPSKSMLFNGNRPVAPLEKAFANAVTIMTDMPSPYNSAAALAQARQRAGGCSKDLYKIYEENQ